MQRITISLDDELAEQFDSLAQERAYQSRSEAMRDVLREGIERWRQEHSDSAHCVANLSYVFDRRVRNLASRLAELQHEHHDLVVATMLVRLDHHYSLESVMLRGGTRAVRTFADTIRAERGVRFGSVNLLDVETGDDHASGEPHHHHGHVHYSPGG